MEDLRRPQLAYPSRKFRQRRSNELDTAEKTAVVHAALVELSDYDSIARRFRISKTLVSNLVKKAKANRTYFQDIQAKESSKATIESKIESIVTAKLRSGELLMRSADVCERLMS